MMRYTPILLIFLLTACSGLSDNATQQPRAGVTPMIVSTSQADTSNDILEIASTPLLEARPIATCPNTPPTRLIIQDRGRVSDTNNETLNLRNGPGTSFDILLALDPLDQFVVIDGPTCADEFTWFRIRFRNTIGWIAEGEFEEYYAEPYLSG